ncbi:hypothetical protein KEM52_000174, partial [Ascosphaera acerosa]
RIELFENSRDLMEEDTMIDASLDDFAASSSASPEIDHEYISRSKKRQEKRRLRRSSRLRSKFGQKENTDPAPDDASDERNTPQSAGSPSRRQEASVGTQKSVNGLTEGGSRFRTGWSASKHDSAVVEGADRDGLQSTAIMHSSVLDDSIESGPGIGQLAGHGQALTDGARPMTEVEKDVREAMSAQLASHAMPSADQPANEFTAVKNCTNSAPPPLPQQLEGWSPPGHAFSATFRQEYLEQQRKVQALFEGRRGSAQGAERFGGYATTASASQHFKSARNDV